MKYLTIFFVFLLLASCSSTKKEMPLAEAPKEESSGSVTLSSHQLVTADVKLGKVEQKSLSDLIVVNGVADVPPQNIVSVSFPLGGYLKSTSLLPGKPVRKGDVIGVIEDQQVIKLQEEFLMGKERLRYLELEFNRQKELNEHQVNAAKIFQQAQTDVVSQRVLVRSMGEKLHLIGIDPARLTAENLSRSVPLRAPISGFVSQIHVNVGKYVQPSEVLFELIDPGDLHAALTVFQKDVSKVEVGQEVTLALINKPDEEYRGKVILTNKNLEDSRSVMIHCHFIDRPEKLLPGMFLRGKIRTSPRDVLAVPEQSVVNLEGKQFVITAKGNMFSLVQVQTGARENGYIELLNGEALNGTPLVIQNAYTVLGAMKNEAEE